jgi:hypothetical protein
VVYEVDQEERSGGVLKLFPEAIRKLPEEALPAPDVAAGDLGDGTRMSRLHYLRANLT